MIKELFWMMEYQQMLWEGVWIFKKGDGIGLKQLKKV